ncbi:ribbon-helix-helix protein, CopG family [Microseira sp. BLCC-F43]|uniref:ribbon-helix-helix protein, CopG family n=1 Tax=Microseira sp. BLCC-F43 TaxID=3153602 RepID=UPI0035B8E1B5
MVQHLSVHCMMATRLDIRLPESELEILKAYCEQEGRTQTDVIREFIRNLKRKVKREIND